MYSKFVQNDEHSGGQKNYHHKKEESNPPAPELTVQQRLQFLIVFLCEEKVQKFHEEISKLTENLLNYYGEKKKEVKDLMLHYLTESICYISRKPIYYAVTVALIHQREKDFGEEIIDSVIKRLNVVINDGDLNSSQNIIIFLGELMNIGIINSITFINMLYNISKQAENNVSNDYFSDIVLNVIPYVSECLKQRSEFEFNGFIDNLQKLMKTRSTLLEDNSLYQPFSNQQYTDFLQCFWESLKQTINSSESSSEWEDQKILLGSFVRKRFVQQFTPIQNIINRPIPLNLRANESNLNSMDIVGGSSINALNTGGTGPSSDKLVGANTDEINRGNKLFFRSSLFIPLFEEANQYLDEQFLKSLDRMIHHQNIVKIFISFGNDKMKLGDQLMNYIGFFKNSQKSNENLEVIVFETIIGELFRLPRPRFSLALFSAMLEYLRIKQGEQVDEYLNNVFESLFPRIENTELEIIDNICNLFSLYFNSNHIKWNWNSLKKFVEQLQTEAQSAQAAGQTQLISQLKIVSPVKTYFLQSLFSKLTLLVSHPKLIENLPEIFHQYMIPEDITELYQQRWTLDKTGSTLATQPSSDSTSTFKHSINILIADKSQKVAENMIEAIQNPSEHGMPEGFSVKDGWRLFIECYLLRSQAVFSHVKLLFDRFKSVFEEFLIVQQKLDNSYAIEAVVIICDFWFKAPHKLLLLLQKLINENLISLNLISEVLLQRSVLGSNNYGFSSDNKFKENYKSQDEEQNVEVEEEEEEKINQKESFRNHEFLVYSSLLYQLFVIQVDHDNILVTNYKNFKAKESSILGELEKEMEESQINLVEYSSNVFAVLGELDAQQQDLPPAQRVLINTLFKIYGRLCYPYLTDLWENIAEQFQEFSSDPQIKKINENITKLISVYTKKLQA